MREQQIWIAEDDEDDLFFYKEALQELGIDPRDIRIFSSGSDLLTQLKFRPNDPPAMIILDGQLPIMNAIQVVKALRAWRLLPGLNLAILTSSPSMRDSAVARSSGVPLLEKPASKKELVSLFDQLLAKTLSA